jgi:hypothetical protein
MRLVTFLARLRAIYWNQIVTPLVTASSDDPDNRYRIGDFPPEFASGIGRVCR